MLLLVPEHPNFCTLQTGTQCRNASSASVSERNLIDESCTHRKVFNGRLGEIQLHLLVLEALLHALGLQLHYLPDLVQLQRLKHHKLVHSIHELRPERRLHLLYRKRCISFQDKRAYSDQA